MRVFLIHGMGRTPASMWILDRRLKAAGYRPSLFGYFVLAEDLGDIAGRFRRHVERVLSQDALATGKTPEYAVISHSLGGIITRVVSPELPPGFRAFVMLAPPNHPPSVVESIDNPLFRLFTQDAGQKLRDPAFYDALPKLAAPTLVVAGNAGPTASWLPFGEQPNDGIVTVEETRLEGAEFLEVPAMHTFLMNRGDVFDAVQGFFRCQDFAKASEGP